MTTNHQSPFKEGEVLEIQTRLLSSARNRHAESMAQRQAYRNLFGDDWTEQPQPIDVDLDESAHLDDLLVELALELPADPSEVIIGAPQEYRATEVGLFAGEPSYRPLSSSRPHLEHQETISHRADQIIARGMDFAVSGVNAKSGCSKRHDRSLSTPGRTGLIANFYLSHAQRVVAIKDLHPDVDHLQIEKLLKIDAFIRKLVQEYQGTSELPGWAKFVSPEIKQFFRIFHLCTRPDAKTITIRLDHETAQAALAAPRGPANYIGEIIKRTLAKLGIATDQAFNLEFNHTGRTENHPAHIHGALCIPDNRVVEVTGALRRALAEGYRQRYNNLAVHIEAPRSARSWAMYCIKEYDLTASKLSDERSRKTRPDYATQKLTQQAQELYEDINAWIVLESIS
ncbi:hypothetical protein [Pseudomonas extremaustralis]|uniref:Uncharacterized protein n=1 Tax=Pseudomonas extremaustralis TaxID=359110 RepID=A0A5C5Q7V1_9PSED|nr:hypothetical protein [Pseudomonas extremaustralis]EZI27596.1 hypothetical protein PE143B_0116015 [Pseudomonas extremaustralis 14-3 substr. 14-3b]TWS01833.1 hypothetical protein FIV36_22895 [Pseudomonas extremaustralis]SDF94486.1 hypothetical protein SAMN05216591_4461 [Pseudomonas extremaustralis]